MKINKLFLYIFATAFIIGLVLLYRTYRFKVLSVDNQMEELSGFEFDKNGKLWGIADSGNPPEIFQIDSTGKMKRKIRIKNAKNIDWEDMTQDDFGHFFIGDFGNNTNKRRDLTIYKIENPADIKTGTTKAEIIKFRFEDQLDFSGKDSTKNFDLEAFVYYKKKLYLFTKNRTKPFDGYTHLYRMGPNAANYKAEYISKFKTCSSNKYLCWITSAALSPKHDKLVLLSSDKLFVFEDWEGDDFFSGKVRTINLGLVTQKEAVTFYNDSIVIYADEKFKGIGGNIYYLNINKP